jgi:sulfoxide reductase heme-binding subunit YedZ
MHWLAYAAWPVAWLHAVGTGTDRGQSWLWIIAGTCALAVTAAVAWRCSTGFAELDSLRYRPTGPSLRARATETERVR